MDKTDAKKPKAPETKVEPVGEKKTVAAKDAASAKKSTGKKPFYTTWQFWTVIGALAVAIVIILAIVIPMIGGSPEQSGNGDSNDEPTGDWISACQSGDKDMISGGEWIIGTDVASGDYKLSSDGYFYAYVYENANASDYLKTISLDSDSKGTFFHFTDGQKVKVSSGSVNMVCQDFGDIELVSVSKNMSAGSYNLVSASSYFYAYVYANKGDSSYESTISIDELGSDKSFRFKDGQYLKISSGSAFLIDANSSDADTLMSKAVELANSLKNDSDETEATETKEEEKTETTKPSSTSSTDSSSSTSSSSSSTSSSSSSSSSSNWKQLLKDYESWVDDYVSFMSKYKNADSSQMASMLSDYTKLLSEMTEWSEKMDEMEDDLSGSDLTEYINTLSRITQKLNSASQ